NWSASVTTDVAAGGVCDAGVEAGPWASSTVSATKVNTVIVMFSVAARGHLAGLATFFTATLAATIAAGATVLLQGGRQMRSGEIDFKEPERALRRQLAHQRHRDVVNGHVLRGAALRLAVMGVAVKHGGHRVTSQRFLEAAATQERIDFE